MNYKTEHENLYRMWHKQKEEKYAKNMEDRIRSTRVIRFPEESSSGNEEEVKSEGKGAEPRWQRE